MTGVYKSKKGTAYTVPSKKRCIKCNAPLKQTLVDKNPNATMDYPCFKISKGVEFSYYYSYQDGCRIRGDVNRNFKKEQHENRKKYGWYENYE